MIDALPETAATMVAAAAYTGARRGELRGAFWENYRDGELLIARSVWNGITTEPKSPRAKRLFQSLASLLRGSHCIASVRATQSPGQLSRMKRVNPQTQITSLQRVILPALNVCGTCSKSEVEHSVTANHNYERNTVLPECHDWHASRRGLATNLHRLGVPDVTLQRILRHSNVAVTHKRATSRLLPKNRKPQCRNSNRLN